MAAYCTVFAGHLGLVHQIARAHARRTWMTRMRLWGHTHVHNAYVFGRVWRMRLTACALYHTTHIT